MSISNITIRVYGLLIDGGRLLVADEIIKGRRITKFPGGGLQFGEGMKDALVREIREEIGVEALKLEHFYTTDFFQQSAFHSTPMQVISVYYTFQVADPLGLPVITTPFTFIEEKNGAEAFRWLDLGTSAEEDLSLPIDRLVWGMLKDRLCR